MARSYGARVTSVQANGKLRAGRRRRMDLGLFRAYERHGWGEPDCSSCVTQFLKREPMYIIPQPGNSIIVVALDKSSRVLVED